MKSTLKSKALGIMLSALFIFTTQAAAQSDRCFSHEALHTTRSVDIRSDDSYFARYIAKTERNKTYTVITSKKAALFDSCWIEIGDGWLLRRSDSSVIKPGAFEERSPARRSTTEQNASPTPIPSRCYSYSTAYVTGSINIRSGPGVGNSKVGSANAGESFTVSSSRRSSDYCWLKINKGWIAKTARVQSTKPAPPPIQMNLPPIEGNTQFRQRIEAAYRYIARRSAYWLNYVTTARASRISADYLILGAGQTRGSTRVIEINATAFLSPSHTAELAGVLIHESCHLHQWDQGKRSYGGSRIVELEKECYGVEADALAGIAPGHARIRRARCAADRYPNVWGC